MFGLGLPEIIIILLAAGILLFGGKKILELSRSMGRASGEFKKAKQDVERELKENAASDQSQPTPPAAPSGQAPSQDSQAADGEGEKQQQ